MHYVVFFPDELRAGSLSCYGNQVVKTPHFQRLADEGTLFENNYTTHPVCVASRVSLMTGWYPHVAGFRTLKHMLEPYHPNFLRYIHDAGYETHVYGKNHMFSEDVYFGCVDKYLYVDFGHISGKHYKGNVDIGVAEDAGLGSMVKLFGDYTMLHDPLPDAVMEHMNDTRCVQAAVKAIREWKPGDKPMFIFIPTFFPHAPYAITEHFHHMYDPDACPVQPRDLPGRPGFEALIRKWRETNETDESVLRKIHAVYLGMCSYADMLLGRVLYALDETGLAADTTVIASSDHGDWAGDRGLIEKWPSAMDDDITKVPLIIRRPGCPNGHRVKELTQTFDIFPTICGWENIRIRHDQFGISLKEQVSGAPGDPDRAVFCEGGYDAREPHCFEGTLSYAAIMQPGSIYYPKLIQQQKEPESVARTVMIRTPRYKLNIRTSGDNELYDMQSGPPEADNLYLKPENAGLVNGLQAKMLNWLIHTSDTVPWKGHVPDEEV